MGCPDVIPLRTAVIHVEFAGELVEDDGTTFEQLEVQDGARFSVQRQPPSVMISGAGADVNGSYELDGFFRGSPRFVCTDK